MKKNYFKFGALILGATAVVAPANAEMTYRDVTTQYIKEPCYFPGKWQGVCGDITDGVGQVWNGAFRLYQVIPDAPAGKYTLTCNALYRCGNNDYAKANMPNNPSLYKAYIFINNTTEKVAGLFDGHENDAPNDKASANIFFEAGHYVNEVIANHEGGDLVFGIANPGCYHDEWCCFDNFKLVGPNGEIVIENGDFEQGINAKSQWNCLPKNKTPDIEKDGAGGGDYRKCGGTEYNIGQQVELPAGKYRYGMKTFHRYGSEVDGNGKYYNHKWPCDIVDAAYGSASRTPKDWFDANDYESVTTYLHAYIYMSMNAEKPTVLKWNTQRGGKLNPETDKLCRIKDCWEICNGDFNAMPHNNPVRVAGNESGDWQDVIPYETVNKVIYRHDSGDEREAAAAFVNEGDKYYQYVEFELTETTKVWLGMGKDSNTGDGYWHAWADQKLEMLVDNSAGVDDVIVDEASENAPVEYYNLQGVRVENPANGLYIKKQGNKVTKVVIRN